MIDLHLHTDASDGRSTPAGLVDEARAAGISILAVTDHDTTAAVADVAAAARAAGVACIAGIEITAVHEGRDVHILGYFLEAGSPALTRFLSRQRADRRRRVTEMAARLDALGAPIDVSGALADAVRVPGRSVGRPLLAAALVDAGHARDITDAFDRYLGDGRPAFIERLGAPPRDVIALIAEAGGIASLAHPGKARLDPLIPTLASAGLPAIEAFHPDHDAAGTAHYLRMAAAYGLLVTGGSDYHGAGSGRTSGLGRVGLPVEHFAPLADRAGWSGPRA